jgi:hypothetical protein
MSVMEEAVFRTADMALAAYLVVMGHRDFHCDHGLNNGGRIDWCFPESLDLKELVEDYRDAAAQVEPRQFAQAQGLVRSAMFRFKDGS